MSEKQEKIQKYPELKSQGDFKKVVDTIETSEKKYKQESQQNEKLKKLEAEISKLQQSLSTLQSKEFKNDLDEKQIWDIELKLQKLEAEKTQIISSTQTSLQDEKKAEKLKNPKIKKELDAAKYVETPKDKQTQKAMDMLTDAGEVESLDLRKTPEWLLGTLLSLLKIIFWGEWQLWTFWKPEQTAGDSEVISKYKDNARKNPNKKFDFYALLDSKEGKNFAKYEDITIKWASRFGINPGLLLKLMIKEWSDGNVKKWPGGANSAVWLGQITSDTWELICKTIGPKKGIHMDVVRDRYDAESQIKGMCLYLNYCAELKNTDHATAVIYYHMWPGEINNAKAKKYAAENPAIARKLAWWPVTVASYEAAARDYYLS